MSRIGSLIKRLAPPVLIDSTRAVLRKFEGRTRSSALFDGDDGLFMELASRTQHYAEYGVGESTLWIARNTSCSIRAVDTSAEWIARVQQGLPAGRGGVTVKHIDVGALRAWGKPLDYSGRSKFSEYARFPVASGAADLVLVDGRFRVACFLHALATLAPGARILFDDYRDRPQYHLVEEFVLPSARYGRQALFEVPDQLARDEILIEASNFQYVMD